MNDNKELLPLKERTNILELIYNQLNNYPEISDIEVCFESFGENASISLFSQMGAVYLKKFIVGEYRGFIPFYIIYRSNPKTDKQKLNKIKYLNELAEWLCKNIPKANDIEIEKLLQTSNPFKDDANEAGDNDYIVTFELTYRKED